MDIVALGRLVEALGFESLFLPEHTHLPVAGASTARKLLDESQPSNTLMRNWKY